MRCYRLIEYEAETQVAIQDHLKHALLSHERQEIKPGDDVPGIGRVHAGRDAPPVTIRLLRETWHQ